ncbi:MAG: DUF5522 domain-containing protein [Bacteroidia bacterium]
MPRNRVDKPSPNEDYYTENGYLVFTEAYHKKRGFCCGSGCRHCPYSPKHQKGNRQLKP